MRRVACIALPEIRVEIARERAACAPASPLAVVVARKGGAVKVERDVLGATRLDVVSREARAYGIHAGQTVAAARARHAGLCVRVVEEDAVRGALARVAELALAFGPAASFDAAEDVVWVDVSGCAHLHSGEPELARALEARVAALGHACRVALADGPRIAAAVARFAEDGQGSGPWVVPAGEGATALGELPIAALALDESTVHWLLALGLSRCRDLQALPSQSLGTRLGARAHDVMGLLAGEDGAPLGVWRPPPVPEERAELDWGASSVEALAFVIKELCDRLAARLRGRAMAAERLELVLSLDRALCQEGVEAISTFVMVLPSPLARAADLLAVVRARLEGCTLAAPALAVTLRAPALAPSAANTASLFEPEPKAAYVLPRLVAELSAELGPARVGVLALVDTWMPDERTRLRTLDRERSQSPTRLRTLAEQSEASRAIPLVTSALEPSRIVPPSHVPLGALKSVHPLVRVEAVEWWRRRWTGRSGPLCPREFAAAWLGSSAPRAGTGGALAWVELREEDALVRGWLD
jgi:protein ImuB